MVSTFSFRRKALFFVVVLLTVMFVAAASWFLFKDSPDLTPAISEAREPSVASAYLYPQNYDEHLKQLRRFNSVAGGIAYSDHGPENAAKTLVLIHGVPTNSFMYRKIIDLLDDHIRVIAVDLLGFGASEKPRDDLEVYDYAAQAGYVSSLMASLNIPEYSVLVHDMGGLVGWELLKADAPITDMVLLNTIIRKEGFNHPDMSPSLSTELVMKSFTSSVSSAAMLKRTFDELGLIQEFELTESECEGYVKPLQSGADKALFAFFTSLQEPLFSSLENNAAILKAWPGRWRVFWGAKDTILTTNQLPFLLEHASLSPDSITIFPENNHFLAEEVPEALAEGVLEFLGVDD